MREIRQSGSEGGAGYIPVPTPIEGCPQGAWVEGVAPSTPVARGDPIAV